MPKPKVNESQYTKIVNEKMKEHKLYKKDMGVKLNPTNSSRPLWENLGTSYVLGGIWVE